MFNVWTGYYIQMYARQQLSPTPLAYAATAVLLFSGIYTRNLNLKFGEVGQSFLSPGGTVDPSIGAPLMLAFNSSHARA